MISDILTAAGVLFEESQFLRTPTKTHAVYFDNIDADGPDDSVRIIHHDVTVELYEHKPDPAAEAAIERELNARGVKYHKQPRYWVPEASMYQVIYENITYTEKI